MSKFTAHDDSVEAHHSGLERLAPRPECFACYGGLVYLGHLATDECGEEFEEIESVPCRRCATTEKEI